MLTILLSILAGFLTIFFICFILIKQFNFEAYLTPITSVSFIAVWLFIFNLFGLFYISAIVLQFLSLALFIVVYFKNSKDNKKTFKKMISVAFVVFWALVTLLSLFYFFKRMEFTVWDEFSFWGTASRVIFEFKTSFSLVDSNLVVDSYFPGLPLFNNFFMIYGTKFVESICYLAYGVIFSSIFCIALKNLKKSNGILILVATFLLFIVTAGSHQAFVTIYSDMILGILFAGILLVYFSNKELNKKIIFTILLLVGFLVTIKDYGLILSFLALCVMFVDSIIFNRKTIKKRILFFFGIIFTMLAVYLSWKTHTNINDCYVFNNIDLSHISGIFDAIFKGKDNFEAEIFSRFIEKLLTGKFYYLNFIWLVAIIIGAGILVFCLVKKASTSTKEDKRLASRYLTLSICLILVVLVYGIILYLLYLVSFLEIEAYSLASMERYMFTIYYGVLFVALGIVILNANKNEKVLKITTSTLIIGIIVLSSITDTSYVYNYKDNVIDTRSNARAFYRDNKEYLDENSRIFYLNQNTISDNYYKFSYEFIEYDFGEYPYFTLIEEEYKEPKELKKMKPEELVTTLFYQYNGLVIKPKEFEQKLINDGYTHLLLLNTNDYLDKNFDYMFYRNKVRPATLYKIYNNNGNLTLVPVVYSKNYEENTM